MNYWIKNVKSREVVMNDVEENAILKMERMFSEAAEKDYNGTLTVGDTINFGFYRLLSGKHAGRVVIKTPSKIDNRSVCYFADRMTWVYTDDIKEDRCESTRPKFSEPRHEVEKS